MSTVFQKYDFLGFTYSRRALKQKTLKQLSFRTKSCLKVQLSKLLFSPKVLSSESLFCKMKAHIWAI